jgi:hypothetical protein
VVVNLKTAQAIGLPATQTILAHGPLPFPPPTLTLPRLRGREGRGQAGEGWGGGCADEVIE